MEFTKQERIYNPEEQKAKVIIIGAGSTGSFIALNLAKMGIADIKIIDFDKVEEHNIPNQFFRLSDVGKLKVDALAQIIKDFTGTDITTECTEIDEDYDFDFDLDTIIISCVDSMEARKLIFEKLKEFPIKFIDTRFGGEGFSINVVDCMEGKDIIDFEKSLDLPIKDTVCGEKGIIYTILSLASEVCNIIKKIEKSENYPTILKRELKTYRFISNLK